MSCRDEGGRRRPPDRPGFTSRIGDLPGALVSRAPSDPSIPPLKSQRQLSFSESG
ncbi:hypothetical protein CISG_07663 [Coccidioides immitis RMSCC 3703]|uniref:Uncharacterized protein n=1 Tax=Coccidioides immitis RMSCC 3703 TaxID=454286 RepID=A0A0J8TZ11_COCIT|nr:hypothetical protein CISG_07663 [Coccidioides immitis RMSCC 3703]